MARNSTIPIHLALGCNLGNRYEQIKKALGHLQSISTVEMIRSSIYDTRPIGRGNQPNYLNMCISLKTSLNPQDLLKFCKNTETKLGRKPRSRWQSREIDIDILTYGNLLIKQSGLEIPHPEITKRQFVLFPLAEIAPMLIIPGQKLCISDILNRIIRKNGMDKIVKYIPEKDFG